jgi:hypothetical protein
MTFPTKERSSDGLFSTGLEQRALDVLQRVAGGRDGVQTAASAGSLCAQTGEQSNKEIWATKTAPHCALCCPSVALLYTINLLKYHFSSFSAISGLSANCWRNSLARHLSGLERGCSTGSAHRLADARISRQHHRGHEVRLG